MSTEEEKPDIGYQPQRKEKVPHCSWCNKTFSSQPKLKDHYKEVHARKSLICGICQKSFPNERQLSGHIKKAHEDKGVKCKDCGMQFKDVSCLNRHVSRAHSEHILHSCDTCGETFLTKVDLEIHRRGHTGETIPTCHICHRMFVNNSILEDHLHSHSVGDNFYCQYCDKTFKTKRQVYMHVRRCHETNKNYACHICGRSFIDNWKLQQHVKAHERERLKKEMDEAVWQRAELRRKADQLVTNDLTERNRQEGELRREAMQAHRREVMEAKKREAVLKIKAQQIESKKKADEARALREQLCDKRQNMLPYSKVLGGVVASRRMPTARELLYRTRQSNLPTNTVLAGKPRAPTATVTKQMLETKSFGLAQNGNPVIVVPEHFPALKPHEIVVVQKKGSKTYQVVNFEKQGQAKPHPTLLGQASGIRKSSISSSTLPTYTIESDTVIKPEQKLVDDMTNTPKTTLSSSTLPKSAVESPKVNSKVEPKPQLSWKDFEVDGLVPEFLTAERTNAKKRTRKIYTISEKLEELKKANETLEATMSSYSGLQKEKQLQNETERAPDTGGASPTDSGTTSDDTAGNLFTTKPEKTSTEKHLDLHQSFGEEHEDFETLMTDLEALPFETDITEIDQNPLDTSNHKTKNTEQCETEEKNKGAMGPLFFCSQCQKEFLTINELSVHEEQHLLALPDLPPEPEMPTNKDCVESITLNRCEPDNITQNQNTVISINATDKTTKVMPCPRCTLAFTDQEELGNHLKQSRMCGPNIPQVLRKTTDVKYIPKTVKQFDDYNDQQTIGPVTCKVCLEEFDDPCILSLHMTVHSVIGENLLLQQPKKHVDKRQNSCIMCEKSFINQTFLDKHLATHYEKMQLTCRECNKVFLGLTELREHQRACKKSEVKKINEEKTVSASQCYICGKKYSGDEHEEAHMQVHEKLHTPTCLTCGQHFDTASMLNVHMEVMNHTEAMFFWCEPCNKMIHSSFRRELHMEQHRVPKEDEEPTEVCETCGGHFTDLKSHILKEHMVQPAPNESFTCTTCGDEFDTSSMLEIHMEIMKHGQIKREENISSGFVVEGTSAPLTKHEQIKTENTSNSFVEKTSAPSPGNERTKSLSCTECNKVFHNSGALRLHMLKHSKDAKQICRICGKFVADFKNHMLTHDKSTLPFKCEVCGKGFLLKSRMDFHMRIHSLA